MHCLSLAESNVVVEFSHTVAGRDRAHIVRAAYSGTGVAASLLPDE